MRNLILVTIWAGPALASAAPAASDTDNLFKVLRKHNCATSAPATSTAADAICKGTAYDYCSRASDQPQCKTYFNNGPPAGGQAYSGNVTGSTAADVRRDAEAVVSGQIEKFESLAKVCCSNSPDGCRSQLPAGSPAALGEAQIARNRVSAGDESPGSSQANNLRGAQTSMARNFGYATDSAAGLAGACKSTKSICQERFTALAKTVKQKAAAATGQDKTAITQLATDYEGRAKACDDLSSALAEQNTQQMATSKAQAESGAMTTASTPGGTADNGSSAQGTRAAKDSGLGSGSNMMASLLPAMMQMMQQQDDKDSDKSDTSSASQQVNAAADCSNPATAGCYQAAASQNWATTPATDAGSQVSAANTGAGNYNVADTSAAKQDGLPMNGTQGAPVTVASVPGGGGGFGGGMGGGGSGGGGSAGGGMRGASVNTDIMHGEGGGGGLGAMNAAMSTAAGGSSGGYTYGRGVAGEEGAAPPVDWRQFLPGGTKDPTRKLAGASDRTEIQSSQVNIWNRVSERIRARCAQGLLRDCN